MRYLSRALAQQGKEQAAEEWLLRACAEAPQLREPWLEASAFAAARQDWSGSLYFAQKALQIRTRGRSYIQEAESWGARPYDLAALAAYYLGQYALALRYGREAAELEPENERLHENLRFYEAAAGAEKGKEKQAQP